MILKIIVLTFPKSMSLFFSDTPTFFNKTNTNAKLWFLVEIRLELFTRVKAKFPNLRMSYLIVLIQYPTGKRYFNTQNQVKEHRGTKLHLLEIPNTSTASPYPHTHTVLITISLYSETPLAYRGVWTGLPSLSIHYTAVSNILSHSGVISCLCD